MKKTVLITGCSSGFGMGMVSRFLEEGWDVLATLRNADERRSLFHEQMGRYGAQLTLLDLDVTSIQGRTTAEQYIAKNLDGKLDCLVNNAGYGIFGALEDATEEQIRHQFEVNLFGTALLTRTLLPFLRKAKGRIISISSVYGLTGMPLSGIYCSSKYAVEGLMESLYYELMPHGVQVALVEPGGFRTSFATNTLWAKPPQHASPYQVQTHNYNALVKKLTSRKSAPDPMLVVEKVIALTRNPRMKLRNPIGQDARSVTLLLKLLPGRFANSIFAFAFRKMFLKSIPPPR
jgi:NAD(P)-dependent dehydrogenase (short-subunit alcohol dehydrogenase family)